MRDRPRRIPTGAAVLKPELTDAIVEAVLDELAEHGYARLSMDAVARRAGVGKSALYRRWPSKQDMTVDVVSRISVPMAEVTDTGSLRGDIRAVLDAVVSWLDHHRLGPILLDLVAEARRSPALADALTAHVGDPRRGRSSTILDRAVERGEIPAGVGVDRELVLDLFAAPVFWRLGVRRVPITPEYLDNLTDALLRVLTTPSAPAHNTTSTPPGADHAGRAASTRSSIQTVQRQNLSG